ncbi:hypothetical protein LPB72_08165 [Hydrogenophaga crassostreae]|uniref:Transglycosylase SLT domain-containing protein n=1 Tax=Hydrogenophaga crassostreae TaxID=1763535 RepID=A0A167IB72_9BURK|nr:transglycosylase SLT domain-containing protein [Hydrogenophaga crassostreae]AOW12404.1 hypothetical protein LPB072_05585 [Hydrogenophaga crassostreae]OAD42455.1 hypothetical protein LPB72_08165 [Hydrogenophaga crassostreae]
MRSNLCQLLLAALACGAGMAGAEASQRTTLADHPPAAPQGENADPGALVALGQAALGSMNLDLAAQSYCHATRLGSVEGSYRLGRLLLQQRGFPRARAQARFVLQHAAELGNEEAKRLITTDTAFGGQAALRPSCLPETPRPMATGWVPASYDLQAQPVTAEEVERYLGQLNPERRSWAKQVQERAPFYGVDPRLAVSVVRAESNFDPDALSSANAQGLMQLIPATAIRFGVSDPKDPAQNIEGGLAYLRWLLNRFDHDVLKTTAAYNAGEGAVERYQGVPPYPETQAYVERILQFYRAAVHKAPPVPKARRNKLTKPRG